MKPGLFNLLTKVAGRGHRAFLDDHFSSPNWKNFKEGLSSPGFVKAVKKDPRADQKLRRYAENNSKHMRAKNVPTFPVPSQSGTGSYDVKFHPDAERFSCDCGDWVHQRSWRTGKRTQDCKHIKMVKTELRGNGVSTDSLRKTAMAGAASRILDIELKNGVGAGSR